MFLLTDPTLISINHIQKAQKQADSCFNDVIAQLYQETFKTQQKAKEERVKQAKGKAIEEERILEEKHKLYIERQQQEAEAINQSRERDRENATVQNNSNAQNTDNTEANIQTSEPTQSSTSSVIGNDWSQVSPGEASQYLSNRTGVSADWWLKVAMAESSGNPTALNSIGCFGLYQINQSVHGNYQGATPEQYLNKVIEIYNSQGKGAWEVVGMNGW